MAKNPYEGENFRTYLKRRLKNPEYRRHYELARARLKLQMKIQEMVKKSHLSIRNLSQGADLCGAATAGRA